MSGDPKFKLLFQFYHSINFNSSHTFLQFSHLQNQEGKRVVKNPPWNLWTWCFKLTICLIFGSEIEFGSSCWSEIWQPLMCKFWEPCKIYLSITQEIFKHYFLLGRLDKMAVFMILAELIYLMGGEDESCNVFCNNDNTNE